MTASATLPRMFFLIDGLRVLAALAVAIFHYKNFFTTDLTEGIAPGAYREIPTLEPLGLILNHGGLAVMLFWCISGFVFAHVYYPVRMNAWDFFVNRFSRLYPLHFTTLILVAVMQAVAVATLGTELVYGNNDLFHFSLQLVFASNWGWEAGLSFNGPIWSVSMEVLIYAAFLVSVLLFGGSWLGVGIMMALFLGLSLAMDSLVPIAGVYFYAGALAYKTFLLVRQRDRRIVVACAIGIGLLPAAASLTVEVPTTISLAAVFAAVLVVLGLHEADRPGRYERLKPYGDLTYAMYLLHMPIVILLLLAGNLGAFGPGLLLTWWFPLVYLAVLVLLSRFVFLRLERPAQIALRTAMKKRVSPAS